MTYLSREFVFTSAALACAALASLHDVRERRIPNALTGSSIVLALLFHLATGGWKEMATSALAGVIAGGLLLVFFLAGGLGAGDVKLMAAIACFTGLHMLPAVLFTTAVCGAVLGLALAVKHQRVREIVQNAITLIHHHREQGLVPHAELNIDNTATLRMPFALAIAAGCLITAGMQMWKA